jgi:hypothetical protein
VNPDLVVRDEDGKVKAVRYEAVNTMLLNEFLKEHRKIEERTVERVLGVGRDVAVIAAAIRLDKRPRIWEKSPSLKQNLD